MCCSRKQSESSSVLSTIRGVACEEGVQMSLSFLSVELELITSESARILRTIAWRAERSILLRYYDVEFPFFRFDQC